MSGVSRRVEAVLEADAEVVRAVVVQGRWKDVPQLVGFVQRSPVGLAEESAERAGDFAERVSCALLPVLSEHHRGAMPVISLAAIPLAPDGEPDRTALARRAEDFLRSLGVLTNIWAAILGPEIDAKSSFLAHGGGSLSAMRVVNRIRDEFGVRLRMSVLLSTRTAFDVAACIASDHLDTPEGVA